MVGGSSALGRGKSGVPTTFRAEQGFAGDGFQRPLVPRSRFQPRLKPGVKSFVPSRIRHMTEVTQLLGGAPELEAQAYDRGD